MPLIPDIHARYLRHVRCPEYDPDIASGIHVYTGIQSKGAAYIPALASVLRVKT